MHKCISIHSTSRIPLISLDDHRVAQLLYLPRRSPAITKPRSWAHITWKSDWSAALNSDMAWPILLPSDHVTMLDLVTFKIYHKTRRNEVYSSHCSWGATAKVWWQGVASRVLLGKSLEVRLTRGRTSCDTGWYWKHLSSVLETWIITYNYLSIHCFTIICLLNSSNFVGLSHVYHRSPFRPSNPKPPSPAKLDVEPRPSPPRCWGPIGTPTGGEVVSDGQCYGDFHGHGDTPRSLDGSGKIPIYDE